jgi:hypothetical protein
MTIKTSINTSIKICFWNTGGLKSKSNDKTSDPIFLKEIEKYELVFLAETHVGYNTDIHTIESRISMSSPWVYAEPLGG